MYYCWSCGTTWCINEDGEFVERYPEDTSELAEAEHELEHKTCPNCEKKQS
jgi:hypothetical protein